MCSKEKEKYSYNIFRISYLIKILLAGGTAFIVLNFLSYFYYSPPQKEASKMLATDFILEPNHNGYIMDEGMAKFSIDEKGYNNDSGIDTNHINILVMGSSHTIGYNVDRNYNYASVLKNDLQGSAYRNISSVYNIGMWGHTWYMQANNFENAIQQFQPSDYVIMELHDQLDFSVQELANILDNNFHRQSADSRRLVTLLKRFPYLQLAMHQIKNVLSDEIPENASSNSKEKVYDQSYYEEYEDLLEQVIQNLTRSLKGSSCKLIILYQPHLVLREDGGADIATLNHDYVSIFKEVCERNQVIFCDVSEEFLTNYQENHQLPHGFINTEVGVGHLNSTGHRIIGDSLYKTILEGKEVGGKGL